MGSGVKKGFSLIELVTVVAILLALSFFAMPTLEIVYVKAREKQLRERLFEIRRGIDAYVAARNTTGGSPYPPTLASLTTPIPDNLLKPGANAGPFLTNESLGNPFFLRGTDLYWDLRPDIATVSWSAALKDVASNSLDIKKARYFGAEPYNFNQIRTKIIDEGWVLDWKVAGQKLVLGEDVKIFDVRFPKCDVDGWKKAIDDTEYYKW